MAAARNTDEEKWVQDNYLEPRLFDFIGQAFVGIPDSGDHGGEFGKYPRTPEELHLMNDELDLGPSLDEIRTLPMQNTSNYTLVRNSTPRGNARGRMPSASTPLRVAPEFRDTAATQERTHLAPPGDTVPRGSTTPSPDLNQMRIAYGTNLRHDVDHRDLHFRVATSSNNDSQDASPKAGVRSLPTLVGPSARKKHKSAETGLSEVVQDISSRALGRIIAVATTTPYVIEHKRKRESVETGTETNQGSDHGARVTINVDQGRPGSRAPAPKILPAVGLATPCVLPSAVQQLATMYPTAVLRPMASQSGLAMILTDATAPWHAHQRSGLPVQTGPHQDQQAAGQPSIDQHHRADVQVEDPKQCGVCDKRFRRYMIPGQRTSVPSAPRTPAAQTLQVLSGHGLGITSAGSIESTSSAVFSQGPPFDHTFTPLTAPTSDPMSRAGLGSSGSTGERRGPTEDSPLLRK
nr:hypothetical protein B0A51_09259 [Rachicladosporium sp. CCFEE 5018]